MVPPLDESVIRVKSLKTVPEEVVELDKANVVISGGRGIADKEDFEILDALAKALSKSHGKVHDRMQQAGGGQMLDVLRPPGRFDRFDDRP